MQEIIQLFKEIPTIFLVLILILELFLLYKAQTVFGRVFVSKKVTRLNMIGKMPSTVLHELSHYFMAVILFVPRGKVKLFSPTLQPDGSIIFGYVETQYKNPFSHALIALAPVILIPPFMAILFTLIYLSGNYLYMIIMLAFSLIAGSAAFPSPGDKPGIIGLILVTVAILAIILFFGEIFIIFAVLLYMPSAISSLLTLMWISASSA